MTQDYDPSAQRSGLDEERLSAALETIARLPAEQRRVALANPLPYLEQAGVRPAAGIEIKLLDKELDPAGFPALPQLTGVDLPPGRVKLCFQICTIDPWIVGGISIGLKRVCRLFCILI